MKPTIESIYKKGLIKFNELLLNNYLELRIDETDVILLMLLHENELNGNNFLSVGNISAMTTLDIDKVADRIDMLVTKGFISLDIIEIEGISEERFSLVSTLNMLISDESEEVKIVTDTKKYAEMLETELKRPLSSKELQIIMEWNYTVEEVKSGLLAAIKQKKMGVEYVDKILHNNKNEVKKDVSYFNQFLND